MTRNFQNVVDRHRLQSNNTSRSGVEYSLSAHHRFILARLVANGGEASLVELACDVVTQLSDDPDTEVNSVQLQRWYLILRQTIAENLASQGAVEYSDEDGTVRIIPCDRGHLDVQSHR